LVTTEGIIATALLSIGVLFILWFIAYLTSRFIWFFNYVFFPINYIIWVLWNPFRFFAKNNSRFTYFMYKIFLFSGIKFVWDIFIYIITFVPRIVLSIYYDLFLYWALSFEQSVRDFAMPKNWHYRSSGWFKYVGIWILYLPYRFFIFTLKNIILFVDGALMAIISTAFPSFTMYHGTSFKDAAVPITQKGAWKVGDRNYAGTGLYFGIERRVAENYSRGDEAVIILVRVTFLPMRLGSTLPPKIYDLVGKNGDELSRRVRGFYRTHEHWRKDNKWWEYCLLMPEQGRFVRTWRVRPIAVMDRDRRFGMAGLRSIWNGMYHIAYVPSAWAAAFVGVGILYGLAMLFAAMGR
jgi:hypothetical protein